VPEVVHAELGFETIFCFAFRAGHDAGVINEAVEPVVPGDKVLRDPNMSDDLRLQPWASYEP
jgi:hypothetical protein